MQKINLTQNNHNKNVIDFMQLLTVISASKLFILSITIAFTIAAVILNNYFYIPLYQTSAIIKIGVYSETTLKCGPTGELKLYCVEGARYEFLEENSDRIKRLNINFNNNKRDTLDFAWDGANIRINHTSANSKTGISVLSEIITYMQDRDQLQIQNIIQNRKKYIKELGYARDNEQKKLDQRLQKHDREFNLKDGEINLLLHKISTIDAQIEQNNQRINRGNILLNSLNENDPNYFEKNESLLSKNDFANDAIYELITEKLSAELSINVLNDKMMLLEEKYMLNRDDKMLNELGSVSHLNQVIKDQEAFFQNPDYKQSEIIGKIITSPPSTNTYRSMAIGFILGLFLSIFFTVMKQLFKERRQTA